MRRFHPLLHLALVLALTAPILAEDIRYIQVGDTYTIDNILSENDLVVVRAVDRAGNRVKVQYMEGGMDWVSPSKLLTRRQQRSADTTTGVLAGAVVLTGIYCLMYPEECKSKPKTTTTTPRRTPAPAPKPRTVAPRRTPTPAPKPAPAPRPAPAPIREITLSVVNDHCRPIMAYMDGRAIVPVPPGYSRVFGADTKTHKLKACDTVTEQCRPEITVSKWPQNPTYRIKPFGACESDRFGWAQHPLIPGDWRAYGEQEAAFVGRYMQPLMEPHYRPLLDNMGRARCLDLSFYDGVSLCEVEVKDSAGKVQGIATLLGDQTKIHVINGNGSIYKQLNGGAPPDLSTERSCKEYLRLFSRSIEGDNGTFHIVESPWDFKWANGVSATSSQAKELDLAPMRAEMLFGGGCNVQADVHYGGALFRAGFEVNRYGEVKMTSDRPKKETLPTMSIEYERGIRRYRANPPRN